MSGLLRAATLPGAELLLPLLAGRHVLDAGPPERAPHHLVAGSRFELFEAAGHFPQLDEPERFVATLEDWTATTQPGRSDDSRFRTTFRRHAA